MYRSGRAFKAAVAQAEGTARVLSAADCVALEPALAAAQSALAGGIFNDGEAVADCHGFCAALYQRIATHPRFQGLVQGEARRLVVEQGKVVRLETSAGPLAADDFVMAAGVQSRDLIGDLGIYLPIYPLKGYSLSVPIGASNKPPEISVTDFERKVLYARIGEQLRVAAMVDMVGEDLSLDPRRIAGLTRQVRQTMPDAADYSRITAWAGLRPATPSSAPIIGATPYPNLFLNVGHGALGFTFACGSARLLADLMQGRSPPIPVDGLTLN